MDLCTRLSSLVSNFHSQVNIKLDDTNYSSWCVQVKNVMVANDFYEFLVGSIPCPPQQTRDDQDGTLSVNPAFTTWKKIDAQLLSCLTASISQATLPYVSDKEHATDLWKFLSHPRPERPLNYEENESAQTEVTKVIQNLRDRINGLQATAFQVANFYFTSQAVVFTALSSKSSALRCKDVWFPLVLSLLPGAINLYALYTIGNEYVEAVVSRSSYSRRKDDIVEKMTPGQGGIPMDETRKRKMDADAEAKLKTRLQIKLSLCLIVFAVIALVIAFGSVRILCGARN